MKYETIKSILLAALIAASVFLTWSLMTFQSYSDGKIDQNQVNKNVKVDIRENKDIILPLKVIYHENNQRLGTTNETEIDRIMGELQTWKFLGVGESKIYKESQINNTLKKIKHIELDFPDLVPFDAFKSVVRFTDKELPNAEFDKVAIDLSKVQQKVANVYFINTKSHRGYSGSISNEELQQFISGIKKNDNAYRTYISYYLSTDKEVLLPRDKVKELSYKYVWDKEVENVENYKASFFTNLIPVEKVQTGSYIEFTNGSSFMRADTLNGTIYYTNPGEEKKHLLQAKELFKQGTHFVNTNGGWSDNFHYFSMNVNKNQIIYRFFKNGLPVFNTEGTSIISQNWGDDQIYEYERPYISLETKLISGVQEVELPSADKAFESLVKNPKINRNHIQDLLIGYTLKYDSSQKAPVLTYVPAWYYLYDNQWKLVFPDGQKPLMSDDVEGEKHGLE